MKKYKVVNDMLKSHVVKRHNTIYEQANFNLAEPRTR